MVRESRHDARAGARDRDDDRRGAARPEDELGRIAPGFFADIVAVEGNPLKDIEDVITGVRWVMKDGKVVVDKR